MNRNFKYDASKNPTVFHAIIFSDLTRMAKERGISEEEAIESFIEDLSNVYTEGYEKKLEWYDMQGDLKPYFVNGIVNFLRKKLQEIRQKKKKEMEQEELNKLYESIDSELERLLNSMPGKTRLEVMQDYLATLNNEDNPNQKRAVSYVSKKIKEETSKKEKISGIFNEIVQIVERQSNEEEIPQIRYWSAIRKGIENGQKKPIKVPENLKAQVLSLVDGKIAEIEEEIYFEQVRDFTNGFSFLAEDVDVEIASGKRYRKLFTDSKYYERFSKLRDRIKDNYSEYKGNYSEYRGIQQVLNDKNDPACESDIKILQERLAEIERKRGTKER